MKSAKHVASQGEDRHFGDGNLRLTKHDSVFLQLVGLGKDSGF